MAATTALQSYSCVATTPICPYFAANQPFAETAEKMHFLRKKRDHHSGHPKFQEAPMRLLFDLVHPRFPATPIAVLERAAARGVVLRGRQLLLLYTARYDDYSLPGGGVDAGEDLHAALFSELEVETARAMFASCDAPRKNGVRFT